MPKLVCILALCVCITARATRIRRHSHRGKAVCAPDESDRRRRREWGCRADKCDSYWGPGVAETCQTTCAAHLGCQECITSSDCPSERPVCNDAGLCKGCITSSDCPSERPMCNAGSCKSLCAADTVGRRRYSCAQVAQKGWCRYSSDRADCQTACRAEAGCQSCDHMATSDACSLCVGHIWIDPFGCKAKTCYDYMDEVSCSGRSECRWKNVKIGRENGICQPASREWKPPKTCLPSIISTCESVPSYVYSSWVCGCVGSGPLELVEGMGDARNGGRPIYMGSKGNLLYYSAPANKWRITDYLYKGGTFMDHRPGQGGTYSCMQSAEDAMCPTGVSNWYLQEDHDWYPGWSKAFPMTFSSSA